MTVCCFTSNESHASLQMHSLHWSPVSSADLNDAETVLLPAQSLQACLASLSAADTKLHSTTPTQLCLLSVSMGTVWNSIIRLSLESSACKKKKNPFRFIFIAEYMKTYFSLEGRKWSPNLIFKVTPSNTLSLWAGNINKTI